MNPLNLLIGSAVSFGISLLKRIPLVKNNPKIVSAVISTAISAAVSIYGQVSGHDVTSISETITSIAAQAGTIFASSVATHETITHTVNNLG